MKSAVIIGATGLIGGHLLKDLLQDPEYEKVTVLTRKSVGFSEPKLEVKMGETSSLPQTGNIPAQDYFCCLGTTMKAAVNENAFRKIDYDAVLEFGRLAERSGAERLLVVTALGADASSRVFYNRVKGEVERALSKIKIPTVIIFRPSLLMGHREQARPLELLAAYTLGKLPVYVGKLKKYAPIEAATVAKAMQIQARKKMPLGFVTLESDQISECAKG